MSEDETRQEAYMAVAFSHMFGDGGVFAEPEPGGQFFMIERGPDGQPVTLTPITGRVERDGDRYVVREATG